MRTIKKLAAVLRAKISGYLRIKIINYQVWELGSYGDQSITYSIYVDGLEAYKATELNCSYFCKDLNIYHCESLRSLKTAIRKEIHSDNYQIRKNYNGKNAL